MSSDCIFCRIVSGEMNAGIVQSTDHVMAFNDINPQAPVHIQIIPKRHVSRIADFNAADDTDWLVGLFSVAAELSRPLEKGFRLVMNNGALAGQSVDHVHLHLLGGRQLTWPPG